MVTYIMENLGVLLVIAGIYELAGAGLAMIASGAWLVYAAYKLRLR